MFVHFICHYIRPLTAPKLRKPTSKWLRKSLSWLMKRNIIAGQKTWILLDSYFVFLDYYLLVNCCQGGKMAARIPRILEYMEAANGRM